MPQELEIIPSVDRSPPSLEANPHRILHTWPSERNFSFEDGLVGAVINNGTAIITSPNCGFIPTPPLGNRVVSLNHHLRFGEDDPLEWPQLFHPELPHLACLPKPPSLGQGPDALQIMWEIPRDTDFENEAPSFRGLRGLRDSRFQEMVKLIQGLISKCWKPGRYNDMPLIHELEGILDAFLHHVEFSREDPRRMRLYIREAQRTFLELKACLDYVISYRAAMRIGAEDGVFGFLSNVRGAITFDPDVCHSLYQAKIPVWLIRPSTAVNSMRIQKLVIPQTLQCPPPEPEVWSTQPPIFVGPEACLEKYVAMRKYTLGLNLQA